MIEQWKDIKGYPDYQISNLGNVKSLARFSIISDGRGKTVTEKILKSSKNFDGYLIVNLYCNKKRKTYTIHRLVLTAFVPNPKNKPTGNHKDGVKTNNFVENLEWATRSENTIHAFKTGLMKNSMLFKNKNRLYGKRKLK